MATEILRPDAQGTYTEIIYVNDTDHWDAVNEAVADGFTTFLADNCDDVFHTDTFGLPNSGVGAGVINSVKVYVVANYEGTGANGRLKLAVYTNSALHEGSEETAIADWTSYDKTWVTNPETTNPWTWAEINALEAGISVKGKIGGVGGDVYVTQVYVEVDYTPAVGRSLGFIIG